MSKQTIYNVGIYVRLSQEDMRAGESLSIENQKLILTKYATEQGWNIWDIYVDDGYSETDFNRPGVSRLLEDAKNGEDQSYNRQRSEPFRAQLYSSRTIHRLHLSDL